MIRRWWLPSGHRANVNTNAVRKLILMEWRPEVEDYVDLLSELLIKLLSAAQQYKSATRKF